VCARYTVRDVRRRVIVRVIGVAVCVTLSCMGVPVSAVSMRLARVAMAVARVRVSTVTVAGMYCLCKSAQRHDAEANTSERQTERVRVHV
jgi:hypothetical protein